MPAHHKPPCLMGDRLDRRAHRRVQVRADGERDAVPVAILTLSCLFINIPGRRTAQAARAAMSSGKEDAMQEWLKTRKFFPWLIVGCGALVTACGTPGTYTIYGEKYRDSEPLADGNCPAGDNVLRATGLSTGITDPQLSLAAARAQARANMMQMIATQVQDYLKQTTDNLTGANPLKAANGKDIKYNDKETKETQHFMQTLASGLVANSCVAQVYTAKSGDTFVRITMRWGEDQDKYLKSFSDPAMQSFSKFINSNSDMVFHNVKQVDKFNSTTPPQQNISQGTQGT